MDENMWKFDQDAMNTPHPLGLASRHCWQWSVHAFAAQCQVQQLCGPTSIDIASYRDNFYEVAKAEADSEHISVFEYLSRLRKSAALGMAEGTRIRTALNPEHSDSFLHSRSRFLSLRGWRFYQER